VQFYDWWFSDWVVDSCTYVGSVVNNENKMRTDIHSKIVTVNRTYFSRIKLFRLQLLSQNAQWQPLKIQIRLILTYGSDAWTTNMEAMKALRIFERQFVRKIHGAVKGWRWRIRTNTDINVEGEDTVKRRKCLQLNDMIILREGKTKANCNSYNGRNKDKKTT